MILLVFATIGMALSACTGGTQSVEEKEVASLENEVMEIHDEVMPKMADISSLRNKLNQVLTRDTSDVELRTRVEMIIQRLNDADEAMMSWMHDYSDNLPEDLQSKHTFLEEQKIKIEVVRDQMLQSIEDAENVLRYVDGDR